MDIKVKYIVIMDTKIKIDCYYVLQIKYIVYLVIIYFFWLNKFVYVEEMCTQIHFLHRKREEM